MPISLSKWVCEQQADTFTRRYEQMSIACLRFHWVVPERRTAAEHEHDADPENAFAKQLWGYTLLDAAARACLLSLTARFSGHEAFYIVAPDTMMSVSSAELREGFFPNVPLRSGLNGGQSFFASAKAERLLGWQHAPADLGQPEDGALTCLT